MYPNLKSGIKALRLVPPEIDTEEYEQLPRSKVVKLRFTNKQYESFRDACKIFEMVALDSDFMNLVKKTLGEDIKVSTVYSQVVAPIVDAPTKIPLKIKSNRGPTGKESYFTNPIPASDAVRQLFSKVAKHVDKDSLRQDVNGGNTCVTDVRVMMSKYVEENDLRHEEGTTLDNLLARLAPKAIQEHKADLLRINNKYSIPKGNRKIMAAILNEITFGK
jgi:hypothetical protein